MTNRIFRIGFWLSLSLTFVASACRPTEETAPNIILIYADDLGWRDLSIMGSSYYETPNIDRLAHEGIVFSRAYANAPNCAPSRASLLTGQYTPRHGIYTVGSSERGQSRFRKIVPAENRTTLPIAAVTIAELLRRGGYRTGMVGKWHLGEGANDPEHWGFEWSRAGNELGSPPSYFYPYSRGDRSLPDIDTLGTEGEYLTDRLTDEAVRFIEESVRGPFFLYLSHYAVHTPIQAKEEKIATYREKTPDGNQSNPAYAAMVESLDESVGRIVETVDELGLAENTLILFYSDNGGHGPVTSMTPLRGAKGMLYEGGIRVPLIGRWPRGIAPGIVSDYPVIGTDLLPTFLDVAGIVPGDSILFDGQSIVPAFSGQFGEEERTLYWHFPAYLEATRDLETRWRTTPASAIQKGAYKLIHYFEDERSELYDLENDIGETVNLVEVEPEIVDSLYRQLRAWWSETGAFIPTQRNPDFVGN